jgi:hypothetical protein
LTHSGTDYQGLPFFPDNKGETTMKRVIGSFFVLSLASGVAFAQDTPPAAGEGTVKVGKQQGMKLAQAECDAAWAKANPSGKDKISAGQAQPFLSDVMAANTNKDGSIDQTEFKAACDAGLMKSPGSATTGSSAGTEGAGPAAPAAPH